jgi:hypothetical protein
MMGGPDGVSEPLYRHPADEQPTLVPFSPTTAALALRLGKLCGQTFNHALIQYYRSVGSCAWLLRLCIVCSRANSLCFFFFWV